MNEFLEWLFEKVSNCWLRRADFRTDVSPDSEDNEPAMPKAYRRSYLSEKKIKEAGSNCDTRLKNFVEKLSLKQDKEVDFSEQRKLVGRIIIAAMTEQISVQRGLLLFPKGCEDPSIRAAWHALCHYEADEDIKAKDIEYNNSQIELLEMIAFAFKDGEPLAQNIIDAYEPYYKDSPISYEKGLRGFLKKFTRFLNSF